MHTDHACRCQPTHTRAITATSAYTTSRVDTHPHSHGHKHKLWGPHVPREWHHEGRSLYPLWSGSGSALSHHTSPPMSPEKTEKRDRLLAGSSVNHRNYHPIGWKQCQSYRQQRRVNLNGLSLIPHVLFLKTHWRRSDLCLLKRRQGERGCEASLKDNWDAPIVWNNCFQDRCFKPQQLFHVVRENTCENTKWCHLWTTAWGGL